MSKEYYRGKDLVIAVERGEFEKVKLMIEQEGVNVNSSNNLGTPLTGAIAWGTIEMCEYLIEKGANVNMPRELSLNGETPLMLAVEGNRIEKCKLLLKNDADINAKASNGRSLEMNVKSEEMLSLLKTHGLIPYQEQKEVSITPLDSESDIPLVGEETPQDTGILSWCSIL